MLPFKARLADKMIVRHHVLSFLPDAKLLATGFIVFKHPRSW